MAQEHRRAAMNIHDRFTPASGEAELRYLDSDFRVVKPGAFVRCAVSGRAIPLEELRYWSAVRQEAYWGPAEAVARAQQVGELPKR
jgi:hypothetical protein